MPSAVVAVGGAYLATRSGDKSADAASDAANASAGASDYAADLAYQQYLQNRQDLAPYRIVGTGALNTLARTFGLPTYSQAPPGMELDRETGEFVEKINPFEEGGEFSDWYSYSPQGPENQAGEIRYRTPEGFDAQGMDQYSDFERRTALGYEGSYYTEKTQEQKDELTYSPDHYGPGGGGGAGGEPDMSAFFTSPGYQFRLDEGEKAIQRSAAARGGLVSGATLKSLNNYAQGTASSEFGNWYEQLSRMAGLGGAATNTTVAAGTNAANSMGQYAQNAGNARGSGYIGVANAQANTYGAYADILGTLGGGIG